MKRFRQIFIGIVTLSLLFSALAYGENWTFKRLTYTPRDSWFPAIAVAGSNIYVVWEESPDPLTNEEIFLKKSTDGGENWTFKRLTRNESTSGYPAIAVAGSNIYVVWEDYPDPLTNDEIFLKKSTDGGENWTFKRLTRNAGTSRSPAIAVDGSNIYVVWEDYTPAYDEIFLKKSTDGGENWTFKRLTNTAGAGFNPAIAVDGSNIYVVWDNYTNEDSQIFLKKSTDGGENWTFKRLTYKAGFSLSPAIAVDGSNIYVVWSYSAPEDYGNAEIFLKKSSDGGENWTFKRLTDNAGFSVKPKIAVDGSNIYVVWQDSTPGPAQIYLKKSSDGGQTWTFKRLTNRGYCWTPVIAVDGSNIYVVWSDDRSGNNEIYLMKGIMY